ncbi:transposase [Candidatus Tenderia electrophaga]|uniref:Transposase n=1 Tax=Candidatus Tenderia electrophaga TaxID=1748243 RepID=A0A0S2THI2_9GAMM|nr:transposase [Candidatus Tenderia electrophaga]
MSNVSMQSILATHLDHYRQHHTLTPQQARACHRIGLCRSAALGGEQVRCSQCDFEQYRYHSCRNRHCPQCQRNASETWSRQRTAQLLPVPYFHLVFTLPHQLNPWVDLHPEVIYRLLFQCVWSTLKTFANDPKRLDGDLGMIAVLHTWGQNLSRHIHLHCLIPGGAWNEETQQWHPAKSSYLFPVRALSRKFRGAMVNALRKSRQAQALHRLTDDKHFNDTLKQLMQTDWVVYTQANIQRPETIINYLARYTHKIAMDNHRLIDSDDQHVRFRYKDYRDHDKHKIMQLEHGEFIRRFLQHILPDGFMRIRHYGILANRCRQQRTDSIKHALAVTAELDVDTRDQDSPHSPAPIPPAATVCRCPRCKNGRLVIIATLLPQRRREGTD